ncbi:MAG TPA: YoaK family protein [Candidatus Aquilonibacter sp.]|nr:YoaK family protein [Candidatus Aquilonibacter sp.]
MKNPLPILLALTLVTGFIDALAFIGYDHVFISNMSGNTVLLGIALVSNLHVAGLSSSPWGYVVSIASFAVGVGGGFLILRDGATPGRSAAIVGCEALLALAAFSARGHAGLSIVPLAIGAGAQSMLALRLGLPGISTAYVTGTIVKTVSLALSERGQGKGRQSIHSAGSWVAYCGGAALGAVGWLGLREMALLPAAGAFALLAFFAGRR